MFKVRTRQTCRARVFGVIYCCDAVSRCDGALVVVDALIGVGLAINWYWF
jgi:hypothetical protein